MNRKDVRNHNLQKIRGPAVNEAGYQAAAG